MSTPTRSDVFAEIQRFAAERLGADAPVVQESSTLKDVGLTSLDAIELLFHIEEHFGIDLGNQGPDFASGTVGQLVDTICASSADGAATT